MSDEEELEGPPYGYSWEVLRQVTYTGDEKHTAQFKFLRCLDCYCMVSTADQDNHLTECHVRNRRLDEDDYE